MPIDTLTNGLSIGSFGNLQAPKASPNLYKPPIRVNRIDAKLAEVSTVNMMQFPEDLPDHFMRFEIFDYSRANLFELGKLNQIAQCVLPIPLSLTDAQSVNYKQEQIGQGLGLITNTGKIGEAVQGMKNGQATLANTLKSIKDAASQVTAKEAAGALGGKVLTEGIDGLGQAVGANVSGLTQALAGYSPNQFLTILLQGPQYKSYRFEWLLAPKNEQESVSIKEIIRLCNNAMAPGLALSGALFTFPKVFRPAIMPNSRYMYKFKPSVLTDFMVNYTGGGQAAFYRASPELGEGGSPPESVQVSMTFLELEFWLTGDFMDSNDPTNTTGPRTDTWAKRLGEYVPDVPPDSPLSDLPAGPNL